jgi:DnaJ-class molecular chaperone
MENYYQTLGVSYDATEEEIKTTYKLKAKLYHPDVSTMPNAGEIFKKISNAKDILLDPDKRLQHDYLIGLRVNHQQQYYQSPPQQPQPATPESGGTKWWQILLLIILALILGSSDRDRR